MPIELVFVPLDKGLPIPSAARAGDAGVDLYARADAKVDPLGGRVTVPTGLRVAIPAGYVGLIAPRSGLASKNGVTVLNAPGVIDSGYRGELAVIVANTSQRQYEIRRGDRIAQMLVVPVAEVVWHEVGELPETARGSGGLGHTGV
jgi:dUTP pyrophosphatase